MNRRPPVTTRTATLWPYTPLFRSVFNNRLQVLDDGRLTDGQGRTIDFRNTMIILTSNLGSDILAGQQEGEDSDAVREQVMEEVRRAFRPEFLNRLDEVRQFHRPTRPTLNGIVDNQLRRLHTMLTAHTIQQELDVQAKVRHRAKDSAQ